MYNSVHERLRKDREADERKIAIIIKTRRGLTMRKTRYIQWVAASCDSLRGLLGTLR